MRAATLLLFMAVLTVGCGDEPASQADVADTTAPPASVPEQRYTTVAVVLESPGSGPQLCPGGVAESYPPQCSGPVITNWDWGAVEDEESANGTTWGTWTVVGTWDGESLTLTEPPAAPDPDAVGPWGDDDERLATPCDPPAGGWVVVDPATATDEAMRAATDHARSQPDVAGVWIDQSINPAAGEEPDESSMNDPAALVLNLSFTGDLDRHRAAVREIWGGPLCLSAAERSAAQLASIRAEAEAELDGFLYSSVDEVDGVVEIGVLIDDGRQRRLDERFGEGVVELLPALRPVED